MDVLQNLHRYLIEGLAIAVVMCVIQNRKLNVFEVLKVAASGVLVLMVLDLASPNITTSVRQGMGFGLGAKHVGFGEGFTCNQTNFKVEKEEPVEPFTVEDDLNNIQDIQNQNDDNDDDNIDNIEEFFREEFASNEGFSNFSPFKESFQDVSGEQNQVEGSDMTIAEHGNVYGYFVGPDEHTTQFQKLCYSGSTIGLTDDVGRNLNGPIPDSGTEKVNFSENVNNVLPSFRIELLDQKKFDRLKLIRYGDIVVLKHGVEEDGKNRFLRDNGGYLTANFEMPKKGSTKHIFRLYDPQDLTNENDSISFGDEMILEYQGDGGATAGQSSFLQVQGNGDVVTNQSQSQATKFRITDCPRSCAGPLWRFQKALYDSQAMKKNLELDE